MTLEDERKRWEEQILRSHDRHLHERKPEFQTPSGIPLPPVLTPIDPDPDYHGSARFSG